MNKGTELKGKIGHVNIIDTLEDNPQLKQDLQAKPEDIGKLLYEVYDVPSGICEHISKALLELKAIKEAKPSEALECVEDLIFNFSVDEYVDRYDKNLATIKQALLKAQESENVLEIIFKKGLPLSEIKMIKQSDNYEQYVIGFSWANFKNISIQKTQKEFDLLKRCLNGK